jgi:hypothetical protein
VTANIQIVLIVQTNCNLESVVAYFELLNLKEKNKLLNEFKLIIYLFALVVEKLGANLVRNDSCTNKVLTMNRQSHLIKQELNLKN